MALYRYSYIGKVNRMHWNKQAKTNFKQFRKKGNKCIMCDCVCKCECDCMWSVFRTSKIVAICLPAIRFSTSGGDLPLVVLVNENRWINDSALPGDVDTELLAFADADVIETIDDRFSLFDVIDDVTTVDFVDIWLIDVFVQTLLLVTLLFVWIELPFNMFRGNGFGLIMSTKKKIK